MVIQFLGTAAAEGWPALFCICDSCKKARELGGKEIRTRSSSLIDGKIQIDFPPDAFHHFLTYNTDLPNIKHIIFTHSHHDHCSLDDMGYIRKGFSRIADDFEKVNIYGNDKVISKFRNKVGNGVTDTYFNLHEIDFYKPFQIDDTVITPLPALHDRSEKCMIYMFECGDKRLFYGNDTGIPNPEVFDYIKGKYFDLVSMDCTMGKYKDGNNHMGVEDTIELSRMFLQNNADESTKFIITHFSHNGHMLYGDLVERTSQYKFIVAYDGLKVEA